MNTQLDTSQISSNRQKQLLVALAILIVAISMYLPALFLKQPGLMSAVAGSLVPLFAGLVIGGIWTFADQKAGKLQWIDGRFSMAKLIVGIAGGAMIGFEAVARHQILEGLPLSFHFTMLPYLALAALEGFLLAFFWQGTIQRKLNEAIQDRGLVVLITALLFILTRVPFFMRVGTLEPLAHVVTQAFICSFAYYIKPDIRVPAIAFFVDRLLVIVAHAPELF